jgi:hypothetical protein
MLSRAALMLAAALLLPAPLWAQDGEQVSEKGYFTGCDAEGDPIYCYIAAAGFSFGVSEAAANAPGLFETLSTMPLMTPVSFGGVMSSMGDSTADLTLTALSPVTDDPYAATLALLQGDWSPEGEETPFQISIMGMDWLEYVQDEMTDSFQITPGMACADGVATDGMTLSLYRYGDDPEEDACWQVMAIDDASMTLQDRRGIQGTVVFNRVAGD